MIKRISLWLKTKRTRKLLKQKAVIVAQMEVLLSYLSNSYYYADKYLVLTAKLAAIQFEIEDIKND
jgi:hypothetical protein